MKEKHDNWVAPATVDCGWAGLGGVGIGHVEGFVGDIEGSHFGRGI